MSENDTNLYDDMLFNMLKECKTLPIFLDQIFGFLHRRTDFYHVAKDPNSPIGLPKGLAEHLIKRTFFKWRPKNEDETTILQEDEIPPVVLEEVVMSSEDVCEDIIDQMEKTDIGDDSNNLPIAESARDNSHPKSVENLGFANSESYNGAAYESYCWSQTIVDVDVIIRVPENTTSKDLKVTILTNRILVKMKDHILLEGELRQKCKHNDAIWSLDKQKLQIHLDKSKEMWWDCLVTSENRLDLTKIDCSRPFEDLPEEAQAKIEELGWNQERKRLGLPTSDELAKQEVLRKAWSAAGSPFSGPFDPSEVVFH